jgi:hypothetical protein
VFPVEKRVLLLMGLFVVNLLNSRAVIGAPAPLKKVKLSSLQEFKKIGPYLSDLKTPRAKRIEKFEEMIREVVEKTNELSIHLEPSQIDEVLPIFELKTLLVEVPMDRVKERQCNAALNQILSTAGPAVDSASKLSEAGRFVYESLEKICN